MSLQKKALVFVGHGSKLAGFDESLNQAAEALRTKRDFERVICAFLEINSPSIPEAIDELIGEGFKEIYVLPYFLLKGRHTQEDIPNLVSQAQDRHPHTRIRLCPYLGFDPGLVEIIEKRVGQAR